MPTALLDSVDFNKTCEEERGLRLPKSGVQIAYYLCDQCGFCFAPEFTSWTIEDFEQRIYNDEYIKVDPDYILVRPKNNAGMLGEMFGAAKISHLDYGGGSGLLSEMLRMKGWNSQTYDPFFNRNLRVEDLEQFDLVTAFEVFEHVPNINALFADLQKVLKPDGILLFSTLLSDGHIRRGQRLTWWYASPRNGHISLFSSASLGICFERQGFNLASFSPVLHVAGRHIPDWAAHLFSVNQPRDEVARINTGHDVKSFSSSSELSSGTESGKSPANNPGAQAAAEAAKNRGNVFLMSGNLLSAVQYYQEALNILPSYPEAHVNLGSALRQLGRPQEAKEKLQSAIALKPSLWQGHFQLGLVLNELGQFQQAVDSYHKSIELNTDFPECRWRLGLALMRLEKWAEAIEAFGSANVPDQQSPEVHANFGLALMKTNQLKDALHQYQLAINISETSELHYLAGKISEQLGMMREALLSNQKAIELDPGNAKAHFQLSFLVLLQGDYLKGFTHFEQRLNLSEQVEWLAPIKQVMAILGTDRYWKGQEIAGTRILIITEQGLGDALMMLRYVPLLKTLKHAAKVCVVCDEALARIFRSMPEVDEVRVKPAVITETDFDWYCTSMSLPYAFRTELNSIPSSPQVPIPEQLRSKWADRVNGLDGFKVGIVWSGNNRLDTDGIRSIALDRLGPLFSIPGIAWVSLQKDRAANGLKRADWPVHDWMEECKDLMDTAALMDCLDLVITVDTSVVHLAGAFGRPTWLLNRYETEWRWLMEREDSPWYSNVRIFRQKQQNDWDSVIDRVAAELRLKLHLD
jgi:tetratricopeptide (TPR) repeat protein